MPKAKTPVKNITAKQIDNMINKYNKRVESIAKTIGTDTALYGQYATLLSTLTGGNTRAKSVKTSTGQSITIVQAKRGKQSTSHIISQRDTNRKHLQQILARIESQPTARQYIQNIKKAHRNEKYNETTVGKLSQSQLIEYVKTVNKLIAELGERIAEVYNTIGTNVNDFKTYSINELQSMIDKINEEYDSPEFFDEPPDSGINATTIPY